MRQRLIGTMIVGALVLAGSAVGQVYRDGYGRPSDGRYRDYSYHRYDNRYDRRGGYDPVSRTLSDIRQARSYRYVDDHERHHFEKVERELLKFQDRWARGHFDKGPLDSAIDNLNDLARADQVHPRDRQILARDAAELRALRSQGRYGYYGDDRYYRR